MDLPPEDDALCEIGLCVAKATHIARCPWFLEVYLVCEWHRMTMREIARHVAIHEIRMVLPDVGRRVASGT